MDNWIVGELDAMKYQVMHKDRDCVLVIDGEEGSGKSVLAQCIGKYVDDSLDLNRVCFTPQQFSAGVMKAHKGQAVIFDEAITGLYSRSAISSLNKLLVTMLAQVRQKNLFIIIVLPTFYDLDRNIALWRTKALFHVFIDRKGSRGHCVIYGFEKKKQLFAFGKKVYNYNCVAPDTKILRFANLYTVDEAGYKKKKFDTLANYNMEDLEEKEVAKQEEEKNEKEESLTARQVQRRFGSTKFLLQRDKLIALMYRRGMSVKDISKESDLDVPVIYTILQKQNLEQALSK